LSVEFSLFASLNKFAVTWLEAHRIVLANPLKWSFETRRRLPAERASQSSHWKLCANTETPRMRHLATREPFLRTEGKTPTCIAVRPLATFFTAVVRASIAGIGMVAEMTSSFTCFADVAGVFRGHGCSRSDTEYAYL